MSGRARAWRGLKRATFAALPLLSVGIALATSLVGKGAHAEGAEEDNAQVTERCAVRLAIALTGASPEKAVFESKDPQGAVDAMLASPAFADRYARFINAEFNGGPAETANEDPVYWLAQHVIAADRPWADLFVGPFSVNPGPGDAMLIGSDPEGLGYFRSPAWMKRYAGNEPEGAMLVAAFRILANTTGLELVPSVGNPGDDRTTTGRQATACKGCHYDEWYALDKFAKLLPKKVGEGDEVNFARQTPEPQQLLGKTLGDDRAMVQALVDSPAWKFSQCRNVFKFVYGRPENQCEAALFDKCVDALDEGKTIRAAVAAVVKDPSFCR